MVFLQNSSVYNNKEIGVLIKMSSILISLSIAHISKQDDNLLKSEIDITRKEGNVLFHESLNTFYLRTCGKGPFR